MTSIFKNKAIPSLAVFSFFSLGSALASDPAHLANDTAVDKHAVAVSVDYQSRLGVAEDPTEVEYSEPLGTLGLTLPGGAHLDVDITPTLAFDEATGEWVEDRTVFLTLPDGTQISLEISPAASASPTRPKPDRAGIAEDDADEEEVGDPEGQMKILFPSGAAITVRTLPTGARAEKPIKPPRNGVAEDDTDVEEVGDPEGIIEILPSGGSVRIKTQD